ncbi:MAG: cation-transporting P-type ATPase [Candidatus Aenigmatarchaeota archaeon]
MDRKFSGLSQKIARRKLREHGFNEIKSTSRVSMLRILFRQIKSNFIVYLLFVAAVISFLVGKDITGYTISGVIVLVISVGFVQEYRSGKAIEALKRLITPTSAVVRDGKEIEILSRDIVPSDIIVLRTGERVPADCVVLDEKELRVDESMLTGESQEIKKLAAKEAAKYKKENQLFMGTHVVGGRCIAKALHTGMDTEFGKIAGMISAAEKELPLQKKINELTKYMAIIAITVSVLTGIIMLVRGAPITYGLMTDVLIVVIALSVSAFPEGFPVVLISTLASGAYRMAKQNAIVNRMSIIETLGETTVICADKTGTITKGEMTAKHVFCDKKIFDITGSGYEASGNFVYNSRKVDVNEKTALRLLLKAAVLCSDTQIEKKPEEKEYTVRGTPTEASLLVMSAKAGILSRNQKAQRKDEVPFSSERKMMSVLCKEKHAYYVYSKGAPEILIERCRHIQHGDKSVRLGAKEKKNILNINKMFTRKKFRVLAFAYKSHTTKGHFEKDLVFLGLVALEDPPRDEVRSALRLCRRAGINVKMITGDNKETAIEIAREIGMKPRVMTGEQMDNMSDTVLSKIVKKITVFARVRPEHKLRIVRALKQNKEIVTMTGDGVNDAPALKEAHIGIAMGKGGTDVSREAADMTLKDDNFATIVSAVKEGRTIFSNIQKFVTYQLSCNYAELFIIFFGILLGLPLPLLALQILFMNLVTDDLPAITLGLNPPSFDVMKAKPRKKSVILNKQMLKTLAVAGTVMGVITLSVFFICLNILGQDIHVARTTAMVTLIFFEIMNAFNFRSFRYRVSSLPLFANKYLVYASVISILTMLFVIYSPLSIPFETVPISAWNWLMAIIAPLSIIVVFDVLKTVKGNLAENM